MLHAAADVYYIINRGLSCVDHVKLFMLVQCQTNCLNPVSLRAGVASSDLSLEAKQPTIFENKTGFSMQVLADLQMVVCSLELLNLEGQGRPISNTHRIHWKEATACFDYSSRVCLALRQSSAWKYFD